MKLLVVQNRSVRRRLATAFAAVVASLAAVPAQAATDAMFTTLTTEITQLITDAKAVLTVGLGVTIAFIIFRLVKRSGKAAAN